MPEDPDSLRFLYILQEGGGFGFLRRVREDYRCLLQSGIGVGRNYPVPAFLPHARRHGV